MRVFVYGCGLLLLGVLAWAVDAALRGNSLMDSRCTQRALSCGVLASFLVPLLTLALVSAFFLLGRLWYLRRRYLRMARAKPQDVVPTAGSIIGDVVGRDELCRVMIADLRDARTRRPHVVVGGIGTGKTALLVRLTKLLARQRAVPVAIKLRDAQESLNFRELARKKFITDWAFWRRRRLEGPDPATSVSAGPDPARGVESADADTDGSSSAVKPTVLRGLLREAAGGSGTRRHSTCTRPPWRSTVPTPFPSSGSSRPRSRQTGRRPAERDPRTLEHAKVNLVQRFRESARTITRRHSPTGSRTGHETSPRTDPGAGSNASTGQESPAYLQLFEIGCCEPSYPVRLAAAHEIGAGGDDALTDLEDDLGLASSGRRDQKPGQANGRVKAAAGRRRQGKAGRDGERMHEQEGESAQRRNIMRAWLAPLLAGSATGSTSRKNADAWLKQWLDFVYEQNQLPERGRSDLSTEIALAQGFKYAANRRREHPQARDGARDHLVEQAKEMLGACSFWFTRLTLLHALTLWHLPDRANWPPDHRRDLDHKALVAHWCGMDSRRRQDRHSEHPFVAEAARLAVRALETGQPERYIWIDESGVVSRVGSCPTKPQSRRKHNLWIPPSTGLGWTALSPRAQQLVADVLLLLNLAERGEPADRDRRLRCTNRNYLPPCMAEDRSPLAPNQPVGMAGDFEPGSNCTAGCLFGLCPYPPKGSQYYRQELGEAFCRRQQRLLTPRMFPTRVAPWQEMSAAQLRRFWRELGQPVSGADLEHGDGGKTRSRDRRR